MGKLTLTLSKNIIRIMSGKSAERFSAYIKEKASHTAAVDVLLMSGIMGKFELINLPGNLTHGPIVDLAAQNASDYTGLDLTYETSFRQSRTVKPGDPSLHEGYILRTLKEVWDEISGTGLGFRLTFPLGTDPKIARSAVQEIADNEKVPIILRIDEQVRPTVKRRGLRLIRQD